MNLSAPALDANQKGNCAVYRRAGLSWTMIACRGAVAGSWCRQALLRANSASPTPSQRGLSDGPGAAVHGAPGRRAHRPAATRSACSTPASSARRRRRIEQTRAGAIDLNRTNVAPIGVDRPGRQRAGDAVPVSLARSPAQGARSGRSASEILDGFQRLRLHRPDLLRFRRALDLQQRAAGRVRSRT